jgi:hypothetical protein
VPAKLAARMRLYSQGRGRKTDRDDAVSIGLRTQVVCRLHRLLAEPHRRILDEMAQSPDRRQAFEKAPFRMRTVVVLALAQGRVKPMGSRLV